MKSRINFFILLLIALLFPLAAQSEQAVQKKSLKEKYIHLAIPFNLNRMYNPAEGNDASLQPYFRSIYTTLFQLDAHLQPHPVLVEKFEIQDRWATFQLKQNARFSDGSDITAQDVIRSLEKGICSRSGSSLLYRVIEGGEEFYNKKTHSCAGFQIINPKLFKIHLKHPNVRIDMYLTSSLLSILPSPEVHKTTKISFSGPFQVSDLKETEQQSVVTLIPNPFYLGKKSRLDKIYFHFYNKEDDFNLAVKKGEPDIFLLSQQYKMPQSQYDYNYFMTPIYGAFYFNLNAVKGIFRDKNLRHFFSRFLQSLDLQKELGWNLTGSTQLILPHSLSGYSVFKPMDTENWAQLKPDKKITLRCAEFKNRVIEELFAMLTEKLKPFNLELKLQWVDMDEMRKLEQKGDVDLVSYFYLVDVPLSEFFYRSLFTPGSQLNRFGFDVPAADQLLEQYDNGNDELLNLRLLGKLEQIAQEEAFLVPLMTPLSLMGYKKEIKNAKIEKYLGINFEDIDVKKRN